MNQAVARAVSGPEGRERSREGVRGGRRNRSATAPDEAGEA